jgi:hypothetical protein
MGCENFDWIRVIQSRIQWWAFVEHGNMMQLRNP